MKNEVLLNEDINNIAGFIRQFLRNERIKILSLDIIDHSIKVELLENIDIEKLIIFKNKNYPNLNHKKFENKLEFKLSEIYLKNLYESSIKQSLEIVRKRIDESGTKEPLIQRQGLNLILNKTITLKEALCGFSFDLKFITGKIFKINNTTDIIQPNYKKVIKNMDMKRGNKEGDFMIIFNIKFLTQFEAD